MAPEAQSTLLLWKNWTSMGWLYLGPHREQYVCVAGSSATSLHGLRCPPQPHRAWHHGSNPWNQSIDFVPFGRYDGTTLHAWLMRLPRQQRDAAAVSRELPQVIPLGFGLRAVDDAVLEQRRTSSPRRR